MVQQPEALLAALLAKEAYATTPEQYGGAKATPDKVRSLPADGAEVGPFYFHVDLPGGGRNEPHFGVIRASRNRLRIGNKGTADATCWIYNGDVRAVSLAQVRATSGSVRKEFIDALKNAAKTKKIDPATVSLHQGFLNFVLSSLEDLWPVVKAWLEATADGGGRCVDVSGHSLGGAASSILALAIAGLDPTISVRCVTFGAPKVFRSKQAVELFTQSVGVSARFVTQLAESLVTDLVPLVPPTFDHPGRQRTLRVPPTPALQDAIDVRKAVPWTAIGAGMLELHAMDGYLEMVTRLAETETEAVGGDGDSSAYVFAGYALNATLNLVQMEKTAAAFAAVIGVVQTAENVDEAAKKLAAQGATASEMPYLADVFSMLDSGDFTKEQVVALAQTQQDNWKKNCSLQAAIRVANSVIQEAVKVTTLCREVEASDELYEAAKASLATQKGRLHMIRVRDLPALVELVDKIASLGGTEADKTAKAEKSLAFDEKTLAILSELRDIEAALDNIAEVAGIQIDHLDQMVYDAMASGLKSVFEAGFSVVQAAQGTGYMAWTGLAAASVSLAAGATYVVTKARNLQQKWRALRQEVDEAKAEVQHVRDEVRAQGARMQRLTAGSRS